MSIRPAILVISLLPVLALLFDTAVAPTTPTPGYGVIENNLTLSNGQCTGDVYFMYHLLTLDRSFGVKFAKDSLCNISIGFLEGQEPITTYVGGASATASSVYVGLPNESATAHHTVYLADDGLPGCPIVTFSFWAGPGANDKSSFGDSEDCSKWTTLKVRAPSESRPWHTSTVSGGDNGIVGCELDKGIGGCFVNASQGLDTTFVWNILDALLLEESLAPGESTTINFGDL